MNKRIRSLLSLLLVAAMLFGLTPSAASAAGREPAADPAEVHVYTEAENALVEQDVLTPIAEKTASLAQPMGGIGKMTEADYVAMIPEVINVIKASDTYVEGSLQQNGNFLVWQTTVGIPCCFDPRMEAKLHGPKDVVSESEARAIEADAAAWGAQLAETMAGGHFPTSVEIGLIQPYWESNSNYEDSSFTNYSPYYKNMWQTLYGVTGGSSNYRYSMYNANINNIANAVQNCAIVIMDSHGTTDYEDYWNDDYTSQANSSYLCLITNAGITSEDTVARQGQFGTYYDCIKGSGYAYVNGRCIANHMTQNAPNSLVYMGICLGMATDGMFTGLRNKGVEAVYGYSQSVTFVGERIYMEAILGHIKDGDTLADAVSKAKTAHGNWDPAYSNYTLAQAKSNHVAFPITVSTEDTYPGHGNVDNIQRVHSTWALFQTIVYNVNAVANNPAYGTVSVNDYTITATPNEGYYVDGFEVIEGEASVVRSGNTFTVTPESDCTVQINFAPRPKYTVQYMVNGTEVSSDEVYVGESLTLPATAEAAEDWTFIGWTAEQLDVTTEEPVYCGPGETFTPTGNTVLHALYVHGEENSSAIVYKLLSKTPADWSGKYVITCGTGNNLYVMKGLEAGKSYSTASNGGAVALVDSGMTLADGVLKNADGLYIFNAEAVTGGYTLANTVTGTYLADRSNILYSMNLNESLCGWTFAINDGRISALNGVGGTKPYLSFAKGGYFRLNSEADADIRFWKEGFDEICYFTTSPSEWVDPPHEHTFGDWISNQNGTHSRTCSCGETETENCTYEDVVTPPTAEEAGFTTHTCTVCGYSFTDSFTDPLGYTVTFVNYDGTVLQSGNVQAGELPVYEGETPVKPEENCCRYTFTGWDPEIAPAAGDVTYTAQFEASPYAQVNGMSLELEGKLGIRLRVRVPEEAAKATLEFAGEFPDIVDFELVRDADHGYNASADEFTLTYSKIAAKEMTCLLGLLVYDNNGNVLPIEKTTAIGEVNGHTYVTALADWAAYAAENASNANTVSLAKAILNYGGAAQTYFGFNLDNPANPNGYLAEETAKVEADPALDRVIPADAKAKLGFLSMALNLEGDTELQLKFSKEVTAVCDGKALTVRKSGRSWIVSVPGIAAKDLDRMNTIAVSCGGNTGEFTASALSWCNAALAGSSDTDLLTMCRALYLYNQAAKVYFGKAD